MKSSMHKRQSNQILSRRDFLKLLALTGVTTAGGYSLFEYAPWLNYDQQAHDTHRLIEKNPSVSVQMQEVVRYATLAANGHNTQPWRFAIQENAIEIHPDYTRRLPVVDPNDRELWISLGCALENLIIAARAAGFASQITYPDTADFIHVHLIADTPESTPFFDAIPIRQNTRSEYDGRPIKKEHLDQIQALPVEPSVGLQFITNKADLETVVEYVNYGNLSQYANNEFLDELIN